MVCKHVVCECPIRICGRVLPTNLVVLPMFSYDIILGMDWLAKHSTIIDCAWKQVTLKSWVEGEVTYIGLQVRSLPLKISAVRARKLIIGGGQAFLAFVVAPARLEKKDLQDIPMVCEYPDVLSIDYSRLPPKREVDVDQDNILSFSILFELGLFVSLLLYLIFQSFI